jgi:hypothetical protein
MFHMMPGNSSFFVFQRNPVLRLSPSAHPRVHICITLKESRDQYAGSGLRFHQPAGKTSGCSVHTSCRICVAPKGQRMRNTA